MCMRVCLPKSGERKTKPRESPRNVTDPLELHMVWRDLGNAPLNITSETDSVAGDAHTVAILRSISGLLLLICVSDHSVDGLALASVPWLIFIVIDFTV